MRHRRILIALAAVALFGALTALSSCGGGTSSGGGGAGPTAPPVVKELDSPSLAHSATYTHRFFAAGTFNYRCTIHPTMTGSVTVSDAAPAGDTVMTVSIQGMAAMPPFSPSPVTLHTGGKVTWTNNDPSTTTPHTVTSI